MKAKDPMGWRAAFVLLRPAALNIDARERLRVTLGVGTGLFVAALLSWWLDAGLGLGLPWLVAPIGASAVIVFGLPSSPLAQPWAVVGGNTVSALVGIAVAMALQAGPWRVAAPAIGGAGAVGMMILLRCLRPPGGAVALLIVLGGVTDWHYALFPIATNSLLLVLSATAYNRATGKPYPHPQREAAAPTVAGRFADADIDRVLDRYNEVLDVPRDELHALLEAAESEAYRRRLGELSCAEVMSREVLSVEFGTSLQDAWTLLRDERIKTLPVVDDELRLVGMLTQTDVVRALLQRG